MVLGETFQASDLIGKRLFMPMQEGAGNQAGSQTDTQGDAQVNDQANADVDADAETGLQTGEVENDAPANDNAVNNDTAMNSNDRMNDDAMMNQNRDNWEMVGEIRDVILNADGDAEGLVIDSGGFLGMSANQLRVSMQDVQFVPARGGRQTQEQGDTAGAGNFSVIYTGDRAALEGAEPFDEARATEMGETRATASWSDEDRTARQQRQQEVNLSDLTTEELLGAPVYGRENEWLGEVSELAVDQDGKINNVIIDVGGFLGIGEKPVALSMDEVQLRVHDNDELRAYVPHTEDELDAMETWESDTDL
jgi:sporulation protein YlmC with PRC-barrel domain